ncbi:SpoIIE family protein phosphatase [Streptomyces sp. NPDC086010]|uniref:SpoIIE family protein phosphatase n=1 Tax=Streptomyces sp. NPDC086010 TaxID=3365745 RepID=UPI0037D6F27E
MASASASESASAADDDAALVVVGPSGAVLEWSREAGELFGRTASDAVGRPAWELLPAPADGRPLPAGDGVNPDELVVRQVTRGDGSRAWGLFRAAPAGDDDPLGQALLRALFTMSPIGMHVLDPELRVLRVNMAAGGVSGIPAEQLIGHRLEDVARLTSPEATSAMIKEVLTTGEPAVDRIVGANPPTDPTREHLYQVSVFPLRDPGGQVLGTAASVVDVTGREQALSRTRLLNAVREGVGRTLEMNTTCAELVRVLVPDFADDAEVDLLDPVIRGDEPPLAPVPLEMPLRRMAFAPADGPHEGGAGPFRFPAAWSQSLTDLRPHLIVHDPEPGSLPSEVHSVLITPLTLRGGVLGTLSLHRSAGRTPFDQEDLDLALELAARTALHIDNSRRYTREHTIAVTLQRHLLPQDPPRRDALETSHFHRPRGAGGGWSDVIPLSGARVAFTVGRVSGEGIQSTAAMGQLRTAIHALSSLDLECDELLARLNDTAARLAAERAAVDSGRLPREEALTASLAYGIYDPLTLSCTIALAGHPPPLLVHPDGTTEIPDLPSAPALGEDIDGAVFAATSLDLRAGTVVALHTDVFLGQDGSRAGERRDDLLRSLAGTGRPLEELCGDAVRAVAPDGGHADDAILLLVRTHALGADRVAGWDLPPEPSAVAAARDWVRRRLTEWGLDALTFGTELIVSELATNAIRYGTPPLQVRLVNGPTLTCEVSDSSFVAPHLRHARTTDEGGRGLFICAELAQRWGARFTSRGKTIWTEQALPTPGAPARP